MGGDQGTDSGAGGEGKRPKKRKLKNERTLSVPNKVCNDSKLLPRFFFLVRLDFP